MSYTRRAVLAGLGLAGLETAMSPLIQKVSASSLTRSLAAGGCPFRLAVINDEITQDFERLVRSWLLISACIGLNCGRCGIKM